MADNVRAVIYNDKNEFLILTEQDDPNNWKLPGGRLSPAEDPSLGILRELAEELGLTSSQINSAGLKFTKLTTDDGLSNRYIFKVVVLKDDIKPNKTEIAQLKWCNLSTIPDCQNKNHITTAVQSITSL